MPKQRKQKAALYACACPNPNCSSDIFSSMAQLRKHIGAKPKCLAYLLLLGKQDMVAAHENLDKAASIICQPVQNANIMDSTMETLPPPEPDDAGMIMDDMEDGFPSSDSNPFLELNNMATDFEQSNFDSLDTAVESDYIFHDGALAYTNARRVEIILMKLLTELEAPLWAFEEIML